MKKIIRKVMTAQDVSDDMRFEDEFLVPMYSFFGGELWAYVHYMTTQAGCSCVVLSSLVDSAIVVHKIGNYITPDLMFSKVAKVLNMLSKGYSQNSPIKLAGYIDGGTFDPL